MKQLLSMKSNAVDTSGIKHSEHTMINSSGRISKSKEDNIGDEDTKIYAQRKFKS